MHHHDGLLHQGAQYFLFPAQCKHFGLRHDQRAPGPDHASLRDELLSARRRNQIRPGSTTGKVAFIKVMALCSAKLACTLALIEACMSDMVISLLWSCDRSIPRKTFRLGFLA